MTEGKIVGAMVAMFDGVRGDVFLVETVHGMQLVRVDDPLDNSNETTSGYHETRNSMPRFAPGQASVTARGEVISISVHGGTPSACEKFSIHGPICTACNVKPVEFSGRGFTCPECKMHIRF